MDLAAAAASATPAAADDEVVHDFDPLIIVYKSGRVERPLDFPPVPAGLDPATGVTSKDVTVPTASGGGGRSFAVRLYLPDVSSAATADAKLPVIVFFHGGAFVAQTAATPAYHAFQNALSSAAKAVVVSVDYRRPPEHPLPTAYDDAFAAVLWTAARSDPWLATHCDVSGQLFLAGDSAGGNIAHNVAARAHYADPIIHIRGMVLLHPLFAGKEAIGDEARYSDRRAWGKRLWEFACPGNAGGIDDPRINPTAAGAPGLETLACERLMVCVGERDELRSRGWAYAEVARAAKGEEVVELVETKGEGHVFFLREPASEKTAELMERVVAFIAK